MHIETGKTMGDGKVKQKSGMQKVLKGSEINEIKLVYFFMLKTYNRIKTTQS